MSNQPKLRMDVLIGMGPSNWGVIYLDFASGARTTFLADLRFPVKDQG